MPARVFGEIPGIGPGAMFANRNELHESGVHRPLQAGISGRATEGADSVVISGGYEDDEDRGELVIYTGHGGNDPATGKQVADQELTAGNAALVVSQQRGYPVRVVRGAGGDPRYSPDSGYRYDGLYRVKRHWDEIGTSGFRVFRYELERLEGQPPADWDTSGDFGRTAKSVEPATGNSSMKPQSQELHQHVQDVAAALELAIETVETVAVDINRQAQDSIAGNRYAEARALLDLAERLVAFRSSISNATRQWNALGADLDGASPPPGKRIAKTSRSAKKAKGRADYGKVAPSAKTSQRDYLIPILEILVDLGGKATSSTVLELVEQRMQPRFKPADLESLPSNPKEPRWRNTAQWARQQLVNQGLMAPSQERGVWEVTDAGRSYLRDQSSGHG